MIFSMTGFSAVAIEFESGSLALELRSVNHRYLDLQLRIPDELRSLEAVLREKISACITRGKLECRISCTARASGGVASKINPQLLMQLAQWNTEIRGVFPTAHDLGVADILRWNGILENNSLPSGNLHDLTINLLSQALHEFDATRAREGEKLKQFLLQRVEQIENLRIQISPRLPAAVKAYETKLRTRLLDALGNHDDERIHQEISLFAAKIDVDEELSRLHAHLSETGRIIAKGGAVGKRLDFMMQELHREANTLGSKSADAEVSRAAMEMKILIEQMREQIQNLE